MNLLYIIILKGILVSIIHQMAIEDLFWLKMETFMPLQKFHSVYNQQECEVDGYQECFLWKAVLR